MTLQSIALVGLMLAVAGCSNQRFLKDSGTVANGTSSAGETMSTSSSLPQPAPLPDGTYFNLEYKTFCSDGGMIAAIRIYGGSAYAQMTRRNCTDLNPALQIERSSLGVPADGSTFVFEDQVFILAQ